MPDPQTLADVLSDGTLPLAADDGYVVTWNGSATYNVHAVLEDGRLQEVDAFTVYGHEDNPAAAAAAARSWLARALADAGDDDRDDQDDDDQGGQR
ncbi:MAG: hypothetical protein IPL93_08360 [Actinomycetales bacterium]|nr:hypothetical protein [Actinomycetales bacterium]